MCVNILKSFGASSGMAGRGGGVLRTQTFLLKEEIINSPASGLNGRATFPAFLRSYDTCELFWGGRGGVLQNQLAHILCSPLGLVSAGRAGVEVEGAMEGGLSFGGVGMRFEGSEGRR